MLRRVVVSADDRRDPAPRPPVLRSTAHPAGCASEQSVLGAMMMSKDAVANVVEVLKAVTSTGPRMS